VLDYRKKAGVIVVLTDGEETCGASPCMLGKQLRAVSAQLTVHVIGFRMKDFSWTGESSVLDTRCLVEENNGLYLSAENRDDLVAPYEPPLSAQRPLRRPIGWKPARASRLFRKSTLG
jgi:Ca-activated chloride channel homolog